MKRKNILYAPEIDSIVESLHHAKDLLNSEIWVKLKEIYSFFSCLKTSNDDDLRSIWLEVERGGIRAFGKYRDYKEAGEVGNLEEFHELWKSYYPGNTKWYKFQTARYKDDMFFYFDDKLIFTVNTLEEPVERKNYNLEMVEEFVDWLSLKIKITIEGLTKDPASFNGYISQNLPWSKRFGKILRKEFHEIMGESTFRPDLGLGKDLISKIILVAEEMKNQETPLLPEMTADEFFRLCEICYDANVYFREETRQLNPREKYTRMADGRDDGLRKIEGNSPQAYREWYHSRMIGHPWEICRGGNSTHISLFVSEKEGKWEVRLAGSSIVRVEETVRMAIALHENNIPFLLYEAEEIVRMVTGADFIGIVPENIIPRYCHSYFPKEDRIIDFMNLGFDREIVPRIAEKSYWYPLEEIVLE